MRSCFSYFLYVFFFFFFTCVVIVVFVTNKKKKKKKKKKSPDHNIKYTCVFNTYVRLPNGKHKNNRFGLKFYEFNDQTTTGERK